MKIKYILSFFIAVVLFLSLSFYSCTYFLPGDEESGDIEIKDSEDTAIEAPGGEEDEPESTVAGEDKKEEEGKEAPEDLDEQEEEKDIIVESPRPSQVISSPLIITGEARGTWFFEANFPVRLLDGSGEEIAVHYAEALNDWMTEDFVPFRAEIEFERPATEIGYLVLEKDNPSDLREYDDELIIPVRFEQ